MAGFDNRQPGGVSNPFLARRRAGLDALGRENALTPVININVENGDPTSRTQTPSRATAALNSARGTSDAGEKFNNRMRAILAMGDAGFGSSANTATNPAQSYIQYKKGANSGLGVKLANMAASTPFNPTGSATQAAPAASSSGATGSQAATGAKTTGTAATSASGGSGIAAAATRAVNTNGGYLGNKNVYNGGNGQSWCGSFVMSMAKEAGVDVPNVVYVPSGVEEAKKNGQYRDASYTPKPGDLVFVDTKGDGKAHHVGIVQSVGEDGRVNTIEGNTSGGGHSSGVLAQKSRSAGSGIGAIVGYAAV